MIIPIRCMTCGKPVAHLWENFKDKVAKGMNPGEVMDELGIDRVCCRSLFLTHVDSIDIINKFKKY